MKKKEKKTKPEKKVAKHPELKGLAFFATSVCLFLCLMSFIEGAPDKNFLGLSGYLIALGLNYTLGVASYLIAFLLAWCGWDLLLLQKIPHCKTRIFYFTSLTISSCFLLNLIAETQEISPLLAKRVYSETFLIDIPYPHQATRYNLGGSPLYFLYRDIQPLSLQKMLSNFGVGLIFSITALLSLLLLTGFQIVPFFLDSTRIFHNIKQKIAALLTPKQRENSLIRKSKDDIEQSLMKPSFKPIFQPTNPVPAAKAVREEKKPSLAAAEIPTPSILRKIPELKINLKEEVAPPTIIKAPQEIMQPAAKRELALDAARRAQGDFSSYKLPPPSLLTQPKKIDNPSLRKDLKRQAEILEETLLSFGIEAKVGEIHCGPTITAFEVHPAIGVKVQKIKALENDIALNLQAKSVRIIAPIPGKAAVGVEIPSLCPQEVSFKEMLIHYQQGKKHFIPVILGKTVSGENVVSDLAKMPHCIIAGATGSGKSVCINTLVMSIVMNARPDEIKLLMIDPKKVELTPYTNLPHMIAPVITEAHGAYSALNYLVKEMQQRYEILKQLGLRNITAFNSRKINLDLENSLGIPIPEKMYGIVAIIDEFADLMMASSSDLETPIARIAQMARAVGIHLVLATQRPSREVITGLIKANFPTRISFKVASRINSQIILDDVGAESLLGNGDMLFLPPGSSQLIRAQGAYIRDEDINKVVSFINEQASPCYLIESFDKMRKEDLLLGEDEEAPKDSLYDEAFQIVIDTQTASTTFLQRKLKIGYARAASLIDELESKGIIGPQEGSKPRRILRKGSGPEKRGALYVEDES